MTQVIRTVALLAAAFGLAAPLTRAGDLNIGLTITGEITPGVYGRVDLTNRPAPQLVYAQPVVIEEPPAAMRVEPIYLHVPPGDAKDWRKHCHEYHACNRPVYFVRSAEYEPGYRPGKDRGHEHHEGGYVEGERHDNGHDKHDHENGHDKHHDHENGRDKHHDHDHDNDHDGDHEHH